MKYKKIKDAVFARAVVEDGYFGALLPIELSFVEGHVIEVTKHGCYRSHLPDAQDAIEAWWLISNHPSGRRRYRKPELAGGADETN